MKGSGIVILAVIAVAVIACTGAGVSMMMNSPGGNDVSHSITYEMNGGTNSENNPASYTEGSSQSLSSPTRDGYFFLGWYTDPEFTQAIASISDDCTEDITVYAKWRPLESYTITYELNGGVNSENNPATFTEGTTVTLSDPTRDGCTFLGWYTDPELTNKITSIDSSVKSNITLYTSWYVPQTYTITYIMDNGTNSENNPSSFKEGTTVTLSDPTREGYIFLGWYTDPEFTNEITIIDNTTETDVTVYAAWEVSNVGLVLNFNITGSITTKIWFNTSTVNLNGTKSYRYLAFDSSKGYLMSYTENYTQTVDGGSSTKHTNADTYWSEEESSGTWVKQSSNVTISTFDGLVECEVWVNSSRTSTETQYIGVDDDLPYKIEYNSSAMSTSTVLTYTLTGTDYVPPEDEYEVKAFGDVGITVSGAGFNDAFTEVKLTASASNGYKFKGWYNEDGVCLSTKSTYTIELLSENVSVYALNDKEYDEYSETLTVSVEPEKSLTNVEWVLTDDTKKTVSGGTLVYTFSEPGIKLIGYSGTDGNGNIYYGCYNILVDGLVTKTYSWKFENNTYETDLQIKYSDFLKYRNDDISRSEGTNSHNLEFVTYTDPYVVSLAADLMETATDAGWTELQTANFILAFTQYIEYQYDSNSMGTSEYWKYPVETLFDQNGDCEDTSILFCAIAKAAGFDCCELLFSGHMAAGVVAEGASGNAFTYNDVTYYYCETTASGYVVGDIPKDGSITLTQYTQNGSYYRKTIPVV